MGDQWFSTGFDAAIQQERQRETTGYLPDRFWIPTGQSREIVFVDAVAGAFREHNAKLNGNWKNWITCAAPLMEAGDVAPCCDKLGEKSAYMVSMLTIIDCTKWTDKKNNTRQFELKVLPAKYKTAQKLAGKNKRLQDDGKGDLTGKLWRVIREGDKSPAVGDEFEFVRDVDLSKLFELVSYRGKKVVDLFTQAGADEEAFKALAQVFSVSKGPDGQVPRKLVPFNYQKLYWPKLPKELRTMLAGYVPTDDDDNRGNGGGARGGADDSVPF